MTDISSLSQSPGVFFSTVLSSHDLSSLSFYAGTRLASHFVCAYKTFFHWKKKRANSAFDPKIINQDGIHKNKELTDTFEEPLTTCPFWMRFPATK